MENRTLKSYGALAAKGFCMGAADVVPGVSGGTMAFILGIYEELIQSIRSFDLKFVKNILSLKIKPAFEGASWRFLLAVGIGILGAIFSLAKGISWLLHNQPILIWSFFFGLILASIITVTKHINKWTPGLICSAIISAAAAFVLVGLTPVSTPEASWFVFLSGAIAICAMILPGISGSFILVLLGKYHYVLEAVNNRDFFTLIIFAIGAAAGLAMFSRFLSWLLKTRHDMTIAVLCGLMLGSLRKVWPWKEAGSNIAPSSLNGEFVSAVALAVFGVLLVLVLERWAGRTNIKQN